MRTPQEVQLLKEQAVTLRRAGKSRREITEILGPMSNATLNDALREEPPERAGRGYAESRRRAAAGARRYWAAERPAREAARAAVSAAAAADIGTLTAREIIIAGAIAYWCEGAKSKPYRTSEQVRFINSDPGLIRFFLAFTEQAGVSRERLRFCVHIHRSADAEAAIRYWADVTGAGPGQFYRTVLKRHDPRTAWPGVQADYHGCLQVSVTGSAALYREISGWAHGVMTTRQEAPP
jgi:hypothetical protein